MTDFNKIFWVHLLSLCRAIQTSSSLSFDTVERWYNDQSLNFEEIFKFFIELGLVVVIDNKILPSTALKKVIILDDESVRQFFVDILFRNKGNLVKYFGKFFNNFELCYGVYRFIPSMKERIKYSGMRNFLISLGVLVFEADYKGYVVINELTAYVLDQNRILSYNEFTKRVRAKEALGYRAELLVFDYEKKKFKNDTGLQKNVRHMSLENVSAGYDIRSFERQEDGEWTPKCIEVKAVSKNDWGFYWSQNEINKAKQLVESYYLYLLPVKNGGVLDISELKQIKNPYCEVLQNFDSWMRKIQSTIFYKK